MSEDKPEVKEKSIWWLIMRRYPILPMGIVGWTMISVALAQTIGWFVGLMGVGVMFTGIVLTIIIAEELKKREKTDRRW